MPRKESLKTRIQSGLKSIHTKSMAAFLVICVAVAVAMGVSSQSFIDVFENIEQTSIQGDMKRVVTSISSDASILEYTMKQYSVWNNTVNVVDALLANDSTLYETWLKENFYVSDTWNTAMGLNIVGIFAPTTIKALKIKWFPPSGDDSVGTNESTPDAWWSTTFGEQANATLKNSSRLLGVINVPNGYAPLIVSVLPITLSSGDSSTHGWLLWGQVFEKNLLQYANAAPACIEYWVPTSGHNQDITASASLQALTAKLTRRDPFDSADWTSDQWHTEVHSRHTLESDSRRECPPLLPNSKNTSSMMTGFFVIQSALGDSDTFEHGPLIRVDMSRELLSAGRSSVAALTSVVVVIVVLVSVGFILFLDLAVLRRLERLKKYMYGAAKAAKGEPADESPAGAGSAPNNVTDGSQPAEASHMNSSDSSDKASLTSGSSGLNVARDEIGNLEYAMRRKLGQLQSRLESCLADLEEELRKSERMTAAMRLMNLCSGRTTEPPGVKLPEPPNPPLDLRTILASPLATEMLKAFCVGENNNPYAVQFLADVSWVRNIEAAANEAEQDDIKTLKEAVENAAAAVRERYAGKSPVANLPFSEKALARMRKAGHGSASFDAAAAEMLALVEKEVMPRFHNSIAHSAVHLVLSSERGEVVTDASNGVQAVFAGARLRAASKLAPPPPSPKMEPEAASSAMDPVPTPLDGVPLQEVGPVV